MRRTCMLGVAGFVLLALAGSAAAQAIQAKDPESLVAALQTAGYKAELTKDRDGDPLINSASSGRNFSVYFFGCEKGRDCTSVQFYAGFRTKTALTHEVINDWNANRRFAKAYIAESGAGRLEMDVNLDFDGISRPLFMDTLDVWLSSMAAFEKHIGL